MNRIYKVIWSNAKGRYVVVSELVSRYAHSTAVSGQHKTMLAALVACLCIGGTALATPATNPAGEGPGVAIGTGSNASRDTSIAIGKDAHMRMHGGIPSTAEGEIAIGNNSLIENYLNQGGSIVFGQKAHVQNMFGSTERSMLMGQTALNGSLPAAPSNLAGGIAIGENSYARSGSLMIGAHNYRGVIGDTTIDTGAADSAAGSMHNANLQMNSTTLGTNSFNFGAFSTVTGAYTAVTGDYTKDKWANFGATVTGSLNTIESKSSTGANAGVANNILGTANRTFNTNGSVVLGAGNAITNSVDTISFTPDQSMSSAKTVADKFREAIKNSNGGGALTVLGSGNTADYVQASQIIGVNNTLKGTSGAVSKYNFINGYKNDVHHVTHATVIGSENTVGGTAGDMLEDIVVIGNNRRATSRSDHSIILGSSDVSGDTYNVAPNMVVIGRNANVRDHGGNQSGGGDVAVGNGTLIENYVNQGGSVALGQKAHVRNMTGSTEVALGMGQVSWTADANGTSVPDDPSKVAGGVAIGENAFARTGSLMIGTHNYRGAIGDTMIDTGAADTAAGSIYNANLQMNSTTLGTNSFNFGAFSTVTGAYTAVTGDYTKDKWANFGATVTGSLNTIESKSSTGANAGVANSILGTANRTANTNGTVVLGAGNEITNSFDTLSFMPDKSMGSAKDVADKFREAIKNANGGGALTVLGSGNTADYAQASQIIGTKNTVTGTGGAVSKGNTVIGSNHKLTGVSNSVVIGSADNETEQTVSEAVSVGHNAKVEKAGGVALGSGSVASVDKGIAGYDPVTGANSTVTTSTWKATQAAVSVGDAANNVTRQITGVAAGTQDTDAVNVAQLKNVKTAADAAKTHYYSVKSTETGSGSNYNNDGAKGDNSLAAGVKASTMSHNSVAIGTEALIKDSNGHRGSGDIAIGNKSYIDNYVDQGGSIAIGQNARVENMAGNQEKLFALGQTTFSGYPAIPADPSKEAGGIAIGENTFARTGSLMVGTHNYKGKMGDVDIDSANTRATGINVNATTLGTNSYNQGAFSTVNGAYSIISGKYNGSNWSFYAGQNFGATVMGSLNSVESATSSNSYSGVANSIVGTANRTFNSNGSLIFGAGNEITNSITNISAPSDGGSSAKDLADKLRTAVKNSDGGGSTLAMGGGNTADWTQASQIIGVGNVLKGTSGAVSKYNMIDGYKNTATNVNHVSVIGSENTVEDTDDALVMGNKRKLSNHADNSIVLGSGDSTITTSVANAVAIGHNANVTAAGGVALGFGSIASTAAGAAGYDPKTGGASSDASATWKATQAAVSVGDAANNVTRQITGVAAGAQDTDAVNVAQLKQVQSTATTAANMEVKGGDNVTVDKTTAGPDNHTVYTVNSKDTYTTGGTYDAATKKLKFTQNDPSKNYEVDVSGLVGAGGSGNLTFAGDSGSPVTKNSGETLNITGGVSEADTASANNIGVIAKDGKLNLKLAKNIDLGSDGSVKTGNTKVSNTGVTIAGGPSMTTTGIDAGGKKITSVAAGEVSSTSTDAVNGSQLHAVKNDVQNITNNVTNISGKVNKLDNRLDRVGAGAAALAALHPLDFDPDDKWDFAAGYGNYRGANAVSVGAFYRPNEDTMLSVGGSFGGGENMVNAGISLKLGQGNHVSTSKVAMAKEIVDLKADNKELRKQIEDMNDRLNAVLGLLDTSKTKDFPDVPENHWAYEYIRVLAGNGLIQGYPDGTFGGDRSMTRYEFATLLYRALKNGAPVDDTMDKAMNEFEPELRRIRADRIRVDRISGKDNDRSKVERVRVNNDDDKENNDYRDVYGSHIPAEG
ncbi:S-layer homology domain-containing protein [Megasphaera coli]|uniref:S-layer homology domain-containing protein n=1 Tax=Colibacter massiliensis TaxID=1852379 RepID=UPI0009F1F9C6|nr:S-layer homology domain-containing protein [Colibacter massiliensis]